MKPKIKVIDRKQSFYEDDVASIEKKEGDWEELKVLQDLTEEDKDEPIFRYGIVICWNEKESQIEVLDYRY